MSHILIVDDERSITQLFQLYLGEEGFRVSIAHDGLEALEIDERDPADAILTDLTMPRMNGRQLLEALRSRRRQVPAIVMTGWAGAEDLTSLGTIVMRKPVELDQVLKRLTDLLDRTQRPG